MEYIKLNTITAKKLQEIKTDTEVKIANILEELQSLMVSNDFDITKVIFKKHGTDQYAKFDVDINIR